MVQRLASSPFKAKIRGRFPLAVPKTFGNTERLFPRVVIAFPRTDTTNPLIKQWPGRNADTTTDTNAVSKMFLPLDTHFAVRYMSVTYPGEPQGTADRKSTRLNSSHGYI